MYRVLINVKEGKIKLFLITLKLYDRRGDHSYDVILFNCRLRRPIMQNYCWCM